MEFDRYTLTDCSRCNLGMRLLNAHGICAACYARMPLAERAALESVEVVERTVYQPVPRLWTVALVTAGATAVGWAVGLWLMSVVLRP